MINIYTIKQLRANDHRSNTLICYVLKPQNMEGLNVFFFILTNTETHVNNKNSVLG